ncbi:MAG: hypothetical protein ACRDBM_04240, partial [Sporomusa sp.]
MKDINIAVRLVDGSPVLACADDKKVIGATWDNRGQALNFERASEFAGYNMMLHLLTGDTWTDVNIGTNNTYEIINAHTQEKTLRLRVSFFEGSTFRYGSINFLLFNYVPSPQIGDVPEEEENRYLELVTDVSALQAALSSTNDSLLTKKNNEYGMFTEGRSGAGYWHKIFTCKTSAYSYTDINMKLSVMELYGGGIRPNGDLSLSVRQNANGAIVTGSTKLVWLNASMDLTSYLSRFAINVVADSTGNYVELYIYNSETNAGYKVSVIDKNTLASGHTLTFTGDVNYLATSTLTALPTNGTIVYSTLSDYMTPGKVSNAASQAGYTSLPGGLKMCWGTADMPAGQDTNVSVTITYPVTFTYIPNTQATIVDTSSPGTTALGASVA